MLRSGEFASLRRRCTDGDELAFLAHPRRSIRGERDAPGPALAGRGRLEADARAVPPSRPSPHRRIRCRSGDARWRSSPWPTSALGRSRPIDDVVVAALERFNEDGTAPGARPHREPLAGRRAVRLARGDVRPGRRRPVRRAVRAARGRRAGQGERINPNFAYDRHEGIPVLRSVHTAVELARRSTRYDPTEGRRAPLRADPRGGVRPRSLPRRPAGRRRPAFDPVRRRTLDARADGSGCPSRSVALGLICGAVLSFGARRGQGRSALRSSNR